MERSSNFSGVQRHDELTCPDNEKAGHDSVNRRSVPAYSSISAGRTGSNSAVAHGRSTEKEDNGEKGFLSPPLVDTSRGDGAAATCHKMKEDGAEHGDEVVKASESFQRADGGPPRKFGPTDAANKSGLEAFGRDQDAFNGRCPQHTARVQVGAQERSLVYSEILSESGDVTAHTASNGERGVGVSVDSSRGTRRTSSVAEEGTSVSCAAKMCECPAAAVQAAPVDSFYSSTTSRTLGKDVIELSPLSQVSAAHRTSREVIRECATHERQVFGKTQHPPEKSPAEITSKSGGKSKAHLLVNVHDMRLHQDRRCQRHVASTAETGSKECRAPEYLPADDKVNGKNEPSITPHTHIALCSAGKESHLAFHDTPQLEPIGSAEVERSQSCADEAEGHNGGGILTESPSEQLQRPQHQDAEKASIACETVQKRGFSQEEAENVSENSVRSLPELRQFTLELLYAVSLLRPFGKKGYPGRDLSDCLSWKAPPAADQTEGLSALSIAQSIPRSACFGEQREEGQTAESAPTEEESLGTGRVDRATSDHQQLRLLRASRVCLWQRQGPSGVDYVAALTQRVTDAVFLCSGEITRGIFPTAPLLRLKAKGGGSGGEVSELRRELRSEGEDAADVALATVASAGARPQQNSFETFAEKIVASRTIKELAVILCGYFGPLLHLLQEHMDRSKLQFSDSFTTDARIKSKAGSSSDFGVSEVTAQAVAQRPRSGLHRQQQVLHVTQMDETVKGVNAILQVLTDTDQLAADFALDSVCERLFRSHSDEEAHASSAMSSPAIYSGTSRESEFVRKGGKERKKCSRDQHQRGERTSVGHPLPSKANVTGGAHSDHVIGQRSAPWTDLCKRKAGPQLCSREDEAEAVSGKDVRSCAFLSLSSSPESAPHPTAEKKQEDSKARNDGRGVTKVGAQMQVSGGGTTASRRRACREGPASYNALRMWTDEENDDTAANTSSVGPLPVAVRPKQRIEKTDLPMSLVEACQTPDLERQSERPSHCSLQRQQHHQETLLRRAEMEGRRCTFGGSIECDESLSSRTAWLAAQLSTPLDSLGGDCVGETDGEKNEKVSEEVAHILETLEAAVFQPSGSASAGSNAVSAIEIQTAETAEEPHAWETSVQLVLRMLREQEQQWPLSDATATSSENRCVSLSERNPKRRAVLNEKEAAEIYGRGLTEGGQRHSSVRDSKSNKNKAPECTTAGASSSLGSSVAESARATAQGMKAREHSSFSGPNQEVSVAAADQGAVPGIIAAAAAVERAAAAVAQQGAVAAVEHATVGSAEMTRTIHDLGGAPPAELPGLVYPLTTGLAASSCHALRHAVEYVGPSPNDGIEEQLADKESKEMFAELDNQGLDSLVSQLLKLAGRSTEQRRGEDINGEQLLSLVMQEQAHQECKQRQQFGTQQGHSPQPLRGQQPEPYQQHPQQHAQWEGTIAEGDVVQRGSSGHPTPLYRYSSLQRGTNAETTGPVPLEKTDVSNRADHMGDSLTANLQSYLRSSRISDREEIVLPARVSAAPDKHTGVSSMPALRPPPQSSKIIRLPLNPVGSKDNAFSSPPDSPSVSGCGRYLSETPTLSVTSSVGPSRRQSSMKRSPWRSCEPYSSSASTVAASPVAASAPSFESSSLTSSPFSLLPRSAIAVVQPTGATLESRSEDSGEGSTTVESGGGRLTRAGVGLIENSGESSRPLRDSCLPPNSSTRNESRQCPLSLEGVLLPFGLLPGRLSNADPSSTSSSTTTVRGASGAKVHPGESSTGAKEEHPSDVGAEWLYTHLRASDFFDISASARAHLLGKAASPSASVIRALSALVPAVPATQVGGGGSGRRQEQGILEADRVRADANSKQASEGSLEFSTSRGVPLPGFSQEKGHGGLEGASSKKFEGARLPSAWPSSSTGRRSLSASGPSTMPAAGMQSFDSSGLTCREPRGADVDTSPFSTGDQSSNRRVDNQELGNTESRSCAARLTSGATPSAATRVRSDQQQHQFDAITNVPLRRSWANAAAGSNDRMSRHHQQRPLDAKDFWPKVSGPADRGLLRPRSTAGGRQDERSGGRYCASSPVSPVFTRSTLAGIRREAATAGCVGTGGADCLCGGALCLYRSAVSGVVYDKSGQKWTARWNEDGRQHKRTFAAAKYGFLTAKLKAETCRGEARERTARAKHEALRQQQACVAHRIGLFTAASSAGEGSQSHRCAVAGSSASAAARGVAEQKKLRP